MGFVRFINRSGALSSLETRVQCSVQITRLHSRAELNFVDKLRCIIWGVRYQFVKITKPDEKVEVPQN